MGRFRDETSKFLLSKSTAIDLFGRIKTTLARPQFTYQNEYNKGDVQWAEKKTGGGDATHDATDSTVDLEVTTTGDKIIRQTRKYMRYYSGKALSITMTWFTDVMPANTVFRAGYFDAQNGVYFERTSAGEFLCLRASGVDLKIPRLKWNKNNFTGYNFNNSAIFQINLQWLGVGNVQCIFEKNDGSLVVAHVFENVGLVHSTYMRTANLPVRYELEAVGVISETYTAKQVCSAVSYEDGGCGDISAYEHGAGNGIASIAVTTRRSVLAIRPKLLFNGLVNRADATIKALELLAGSNTSYWELVYNPTFTGTPTWTSLNDNSTLEFSVDASAITGGIVVQSGYVTSGGGQVRNQVGREIATNYPLALDIDGADPTSYALVCTSFTGTSNVNASVSVQEIY